MIHSFIDFELDERLYQLRRGGTVVKIEPKVFDVLAYLVRHRDHVVSKDELLEKLWPGESVSESVLPRCITAARKALADDPAGQRIIQTVHGRGYRFVAPVAEPAAPLAGEGVPASDEDAAASAGEGAAPEEPPAGVFVGREQAMEQLAAACEHALHGRGRLLLLVGEPGIGKTRTAEELAARARRQGARVLTGRCYEGEGAPAFWPWVQILRACVSGREPAALAAEMGPGAADIAQLVPEVGQRLPHARATAVPPSDLPSEQARFRLFDSITTFLKNASIPQPLVLILDDLHWADKPSLLLLRFLARELREACILVVGTYRDVEVGRRHPLAAVLGELAREPLCQRITLRGLSEADVARFIEATAGRAPSEGAVTAVYQMTEGNPFFVGEIVRLLVADGRLERPGETSAWSVTLPQGVREAIGRRLDALSEESNGALTLASVVGRDFGLNVLERIADLAGDGLLEALDEAVAARIITPIARSVGHYSFCHALIRETLYQELTTPRRVRLHRQVGEVLETLYRADPTPHLTELAHHFFQAAPGGDVDKAIEYEKRAAAWASRLFAYEEAASHYERALQVLDLRVPGDETQRCELLLGLGDAQSRSGERDAARKTFQCAAEIARRMGRFDQLARAALGFGGRAEMGMGPDEAVRSLLEEALHALGDEQGALRARLLSRLAGLAPYSDSMETRAALSQEAVELARTAGDPATLMAALGARYWALLGPDHLEERFAIGNDLLELAQQTGDKNCAFLAHEVRLGVFLAQGDIPTADREIGTLAALAQELRQPVEHWFVSWFRASRAVADGRFEEAERRLQEGLAIGQRAHPGAVHAFGGQMLWLRGEQGRLQDLGDPEAAFEILVQNLPSSRTILRAGIANLYADVGREAEARREFEALAAKDFADVPRDEHWLVTMALLAEACAELRDVRWAAALYEFLRPFAARNVVHDLIRTYRGSAALYLGVLAAVCSRWDAAARHFEDALEVNARIGVRPYLVRTQCEYARMLLDRGRRQDLPKALALLDQAAATAEEMDMKHGLTKAHALRQRAEEVVASTRRRTGRS